MKAGSNLAPCFSMYASMIVSWLSFFKSGNPLYVQASHLLQLPRPLDC